MRGDDESKAISAKTESRRLAAVALGHALIEAAGELPLPYLLGKNDRNSAGVSGEWLGRTIGPGLLEGGHAGFNLHGIVFGLGQAIGERSSCEARLMVEVVVEDLERGGAHCARSDSKGAPQLGVGRPAGPVPRLEVPGAEPFDVLITAPANGDVAVVDAAMKAGPHYYPARGRCD